MPNDCGKDQGTLFQKERKKGFSYEHGSQVVIL
jgi:hypothetical protein